MRSFVLVVIAAMSVGLGLDTAKADPPVAKPADVARPEKPVLDPQKQLLLSHVVSQLGDPSLANRCLLVWSIPELTKVPHPDAVWLNRRLQSAVAAAEVVAAKYPLTICALYISGRSEVVAWIGDAPLVVPALNPAWIQSIRDNEPFADLRGKPPWEEQQAAWEEYAVYCQAVLQAHQTPLELFKQSARDNAHVTFAHLYREPWKYRGKVVTFEGRLQRVTREDTPKLVEKEGLKRFYEGWITLDRAGTPPICVLFTELPEGIKEGEQLNARVSFTGYFFKKYRYLAGDRKSYTTLLLIGPTLTPTNGAPPPTASAWFPVRGELILWIGGLAAAAVVVIVGLSWWLKRGDQRARAQLAQIHSRLQLDEKPKFNAAADGIRPAVRPPEWLRNEDQTPYPQSESAFTGLGDAEKKG